MIYLILLIHIGLCGALVFIVLLQQGKGADMGAAFGGASSIFGAGGATNVLGRATTGIAIAFMVTSVILVRHFGAMQFQTAPATETDALRGSVIDKMPAEGAAKGEGEKPAEGAGAPAQTGAVEAPPAAVPPPPAGAVVPPAAQPPAAQQNQAPAAAAKKSDASKNNSNGEAAKGAALPKK